MFLLLQALFQSDEIDEKYLQDFILNEKAAISFSVPIVNLAKLKVWLEVKLWKAKIINQLKEDKLGFGLLVGIKMSAEEIYSYSLTSLPLALSDHSVKLQQSQKAPFRIYLMSEYKAMTAKNPTETETLYPAPVQIIMNTCSDNRKKETTKRARYSSGWNSSYQMQNKLCHKV